jgi:hypothetical protein
LGKHICPLSQEDFGVQKIVAAVCSEERGEPKFAKVWQVLSRQQRQQQQRLPEQDSNVFAVGAVGVLVWI